MGYIATDLARVPSGFGFQWYAFLLEDTWLDDFRRELTENFQNLATDVGPHALAIRGANPTEFFDQVFYEYALWDRDFEHDTFPLPALLITDTPPTDIREDRNRVEQARMILLPLAKHYRRAGSITDLLKEVARSIRDRDAFEALQELDRERIKSKWGWLTRYFELKPKFFGFGVNVNAMIEDVIFKGVD